MKKKINLKNLYSEIRELLFNMIPEKWESIYLYASVIEDSKHNENGEMFFYYYPKSIIRKNPVNVYEVPNKFNIYENDYMKLAIQLYDIIKKLRHECIEVDKNNWSNITISIENVEFLVEYNDDNLINSVYTDEERRLIWKYKYIDYPIEKFNKKQKQALQRYLTEEEYGQHGVTIYSETFYQKHIHNDVQYDGDGQEEYSKVDKDEEHQNQVKNQILKYNNVKEE